MTTPIKQLKDENDTNFYPQTVKAAISDYDAPNITVTSTDPGEGSALPANSFIAVTGDEQVHTADIANGAVTSDKIDWTTMPRIVAVGYLPIGDVDGYGDVSKTVTVPTQRTADLRVFISRVGSGGYWAEVELTVTNTTTNSFSVTAHNNGPNKAYGCSCFYMAIYPA